MFAIVAVLIITMVHRDPYLPSNRHESPTFVPLRFSLNVFTFFWGVFSIKQINSGREISGAPEQQMLADMTKYGPSCLTQNERHWPCFC